MVAINDDMTAEQGFVPLSEADAATLEPGFYELDDEYIVVDAPQSPDRRDTTKPRVIARTIQRAQAGSTAATHTSGATLTRYYPDAPPGEGGDLTTPNPSVSWVAETAVVAGHRIVGDGIVWEAEDDFTTGAETPAFPGILAAAIEAEEVEDNGGSWFLVGAAGEISPSYLASTVPALSPILTATVDLAAGDIATLESVPVEIVPTPGAGKMIVPVGGSIVFTPGSVAFDNGATIGMGLMTSAALGLDATGDPAVALFVPLADTAGTVAELGEVPLLAYASEDPGGSGDGTARITVAYYVMDLA